MDEPLFHHCTNLSTVVYGIIIPNEYHTLNKNDIHNGGWISIDFYDEFYDMDVKANNWLKGEVGFYPLFLSVGNSIHDYYMTGYNDNWRVSVSRWYDKEKKKFCSKRRKKGEFPNCIMFSFDDLDCVFMDHVWWVIVGYNNAINGEETTDREKRCIFKYSWSRSKWFKKSRESGGVQCVVPQLDLRQASRVWVRNKKTKNILEGMGFKNIFIKRIFLEKW